MLFGIHVTIDGYGGDQTLLADTKHVLALLTSLSQVGGKSDEVHGAGLVVHGPHTNEEGVWGAYMASPHMRISVHTHPRRGHISIDLYPLRIESMKESIHHQLTHAFNLQNIEVHALQRGTRFKDAVVQ